MKQHDLEAKLERYHTAAFGWALSCVRWTRDEAEDAVRFRDAESRFRSIREGQVLRAACNTWGRK